FLVVGLADRLVVTISRLANGGRPEAAAQREQRRTQQPERDETPQVPTSATASMIDLTCTDHGAVLEAIGTSPVEAGMTPSERGIAGRSAAFARGGLAGSV